MKTPSRSKRRAISPLIAVLTGCGFAALTTGCGPAGEHEWDELSTDVDELGAVSCAPPNRYDAFMRADGFKVLSTNGMQGDIARSLTTYDNPGCYKARKVRIDGPVGPPPGAFVPVGSPGPTYVYVGAVNLPKNEADCTATTIRGILFGHSTVDLSSPTGQGPERGFSLVDRSARAVWNPLFSDENFACGLPWLNLGHPSGGQPGLSYHVAVTARTNGVTRAVDVVTTKSRIAPPGVNLCQSVKTCVGS